MKKLTQNIYVSGQISSNDFAQMRNSGIKAIINNRPDGEEPGQLSAAEAAKLADEHNMDYHYLPMVNGQPLETSLVEDFKSIIDANDVPILTHCRSGMRSTFIWALGQIQAGTITVDDAINSAQAAGIPLSNARPALEAVVPK